MAAQTPEAEAHMMLDAPVTISLYRYPTDQSEAEITVETPGNRTEDLSVRITLQAEGSETELEAYQYVLHPDDKRTEQTVKLILPDGRKYMCRIYQNDELISTIEITNKQ